MARILVVDDEKSIRLTLREFLVAAGYEVAVAEEAQAAQRLLQDGEFDVIVSDIVLPRMTGVELLRLIRQVSPRVQVILMTGEPTVETASDAVRAGAFDYLFKPISKEAILRSVANAARIKAVDDERERLAQINREYQERLERMVGERTRALQEAMDELTRTQQQLVQQERLKALGQMVSGIAHDFNNVLMPIVGIPALLLEDPDLLNDRDDVLSMLKTVSAAGQDAREIVRRLREFYRPGEPQEMHAVKVNQVIEQTIALTEPAWKAQSEAAGKAIRIVTDMGDVPETPGSEAGLRELLTNLIINAVDAIPKEGTITFRTRREGEWVVMQVADTGAGMTEDVRSHCFEPFYTTKGEHGTGLGLAMCHGIVKRHGGQIEVTSGIDAGTTFTIRLPLTGPTIGSPGAESVDTAVERPSGLRVLVIEDEELSRTLLTQFLTQQGHTVETSANGGDGLARLLASCFDVVITDRAMPGMGGDHVAKAAKRLVPGMPVIMLTGFGDLMRFKNEHPEGVDEVLGKPVTPDELGEAIGRVVGRVG
jgi:signal transduction histidine kinase